MFIYNYLCTVTKATITITIKSSESFNVVVIQCMYIIHLHRYLYLYLSVFSYRDVWRGVAKRCAIQFSKSENIHFCTRALSKHSTNTQQRAFLPLPCSTVVQQPNRRSTPMESIVCVVVCRNVCIYTSFSVWHWCRMLSFALLCYAMCSIPFQLRRERRTAILQCCADSWYEMKKGKNGECENQARRAQVRVYITWWMSFFFCL